MTFQVRAVRWDGGWELHIEGVGVTQYRALSAAERMVRDYLRLDGHADFETAGIVVTPVIGGVERSRSARQRVY